MQIHEGHFSLAAERNHLHHWPRSRLAGSAEYFRAAADALAMLPDADENDLPCRLLARHYGLPGALRTLSSELERTFEVHSLDGRRLILKLSARPQAMESFRFQSATLAGLGSASGVIVPRIVPTRSGALMFDADGTGGYLQTRIDGTALHKCAPTPGLLFEIGVALGQLNRALAGIAAPGAHRPVLWNIACWPRLTELMQYLPDGLTADRVRAATAEYRQHVAPYLAALDWQITHNDPSPFNMIRNNAGVAFIDFGDGGWNPRIQDLAIAAGHFVTDTGQQLGGAEYLIAGFASQICLTDLEIRLLVGMIRARHSALILINNWRAHLFPADAGYIMKNVGRAEQGLSILAALDAGAGEAAVRSAMALARP